MREKVMLGSRNPIRRYVAWLLIFTTLFTYANPTNFAYSAEEKNWEVEYSLETDEGIPLAIEDDNDSIQLSVKEGESVAIGMMLAEGKRKTSRRFGESFHIYMPETLYDLITENGEIPIEGFLESDLAKEGYLLEVADLYAGEATRSNASESNATGSNATGSDATVEEGVYKLTFRFAEDLRKADDPKALEVEAVEGKLFFTAPENTLLTLTQEGNDCRITMVSLTGMKRMALLSESNMDISMELYKDYVKVETGEVSWEPTNYSSTTHITTKINYSEASSKGYEAKALTITVHGTLLDSLSEYWDTSTTNYDPDYKVTTNDMWEYYYDADIQAFVFTNKVPIEAGNTFSGYFEITWGATGRLKADEYKFFAELEVGGTTKETEPCTFTVSKTKRQNGTYRKTAYDAQHSEVVAMYSKLPENKEEFYWVGYDLYRYINQTSQNVMMMEYKLTDEFPAGCVVLDSAGKVATLNANNEYVLTSGKLSTSQTTTTRIYVGYPKSMFSDDISKTILNTFEIAARYEDEDTWTDFSASCSVTLVDFNFAYDGDQYRIGKTQSNTSKRLPMLRLEGISTNTFYLEPTVGNPGKVPKDVIIGDDILYISREGGSTTRLQEDEYRFNSVTIPSFSSKTGETYAGYRYTLEILKKGENDYITQRTGNLPATSMTVTLSASLNVVAWRVTLHGIDGPIDSGSLSTVVDIFAPDAAVGKLYNFCYLQVKDQNGNILNEPELGDYATIDTQDEIASFDQQEYGTYMQRAVRSMDITPATNLEVGVYKSEASAPVYDAANNVYNVTYRLDSAIGDIEYMLLEDTYMTSVTMYDILPEGVYVDPQKITMDYLSGYSPTSIVTANAVSSALLQSGAKLTSRAEINDYLEKRTFIKIEEDYRGTGRTKITATLDFSDDPLNVEDLQRQLYKYTTTRWYILFMRVSIPAIIPNSVVQENNGKISNYVFIEADLELPDGDTFIYKNSKTDNGSYGGEVTSDINENNNTTEKLGTNVVTTDILFAGAAHYEMKKFVRTSSTLGQFVDTAASSELDKAYTYLLRVCSAGSRMGNLIVYDTIEGVNGTGGWKGTL